MLTTATIASQRICASITKTRIHPDVALITNPLLYPNEVSYPSLTSCSNTHILEDIKTDMGEPASSQNRKVPDECELKESYLISHDE